MKIIQVAFLLAVPQLIIGCSTHLDRPIQQGLSVTPVSLECNFTLSINFNRTVEEQDFAVLNRIDLLTTGSSIKQKVKMSIYNVNDPSDNMRIDFDSTSDDLSIDLSGIDPNETLLYPGDPININLSISGMTRGDIIALSLPKGGIVYVVYSSGKEYETLSSENDRFLFGKCEM